MMYTIGAYTAGQHLAGKTARQKVADSSIDTLDIKLGTNSLFREGKSKVSIRRRNWRLAAESITHEKDYGRGIVVVSSGSIAAGRMASGQALDFGRYRQLIETENERRLTKEERVEKEELRVLQQSLASEGQDLLMRQWRKRLVRVGQVLVTRAELGETEPRERTMKVLAANRDRGLTTILNENNTIAFAEISFGDNDMLEAVSGKDMQLSGMFGQVGAVFLTDTNGLYEDKSRPDSRIAEVSLDDMTHFIDDEVNNHSRGGMASKRAAAEILLEAGVPVWIGPSYERFSIQRILEGELGTLVVPTAVEVAAVEDSVNHS